jgi:hypothetical protein
MFLMGMSFTGGCVLFELMDGVDAIEASFDDSAETVTASSVYENNPVRYTYEELNPFLAEFSSSTDTKPEVENLLNLVDSMNATYIEPEGVFPYLISNLSMRCLQKSI